MAHFVETYGVGPQRVQLEIKDPRGFAEYLRKFKEHSALGAMNTLLGVQCRRPSFYDLTAEMARMDVPDADHVGRRGRALPRGQPADEAHHPRPPALALLPRSGHAINLEEPALFNQLLEDFFRQVETGRYSQARQALDRSFDLRARGQTLNGQLRVEKRGAVGWIVFDQPARRNAINDAMWRGIPPAMKQFDADPEVRCVAFRGAGTEAFSAGADISEFDKNRSSTEAVGGYDDLLDQVLHAIQGSLKPSVAMIYGYCLGGGRGDRARLRPALLRGLGAVRRSRRRRLASPTTSRATSACSRPSATRARGRSCSSAGATRPRKRWRWAWCTRSCRTRELETFMSEVLQTLCRQCAAVDRQHQDHPRGIREVRRARRTRRACARRSSAARAARTTRKGGARSWKSASRTSRADEDPRHPVRAVAAPMKRPLATSTGKLTVAPLRAHRPRDRRRRHRPLVSVRHRPGTTWRRIAKLVEAMGEMVKGDEVAPFDLERKLRARYTLLGVHNIVLFAMAGIDMAAWDALGQSLGQPLARLLGATPRPIPAYNSKGLGILPLKRSW